MNLAVIGHGEMGDATARIARERGHEVAQYHRDEIAVGLSRDLDAAIHCSVSEAVQRNLDVCVEAKINMVIVTTGWYDELELVRAKAEKGDIGVLWSSNFSVGMNIFFRLVARAAELANRFEDYDVWATELHHRYKADSPSGSAKTISRILLDNLDRKNRVVEDRLDSQRKDDEIHFSSVRGGDVNFAHEVGFDSAADTIKLSHSARNRDGFALGAVRGAEWLRGKRGFFGVEEFLRELTGEE